MTRKTATSDQSVRFYQLGGLGEVGMNCAVFESQGTRFVLDCGVSFPDDDAFGIDVLIPDFTRLVEHAESIAAIVITHGHQDHIGALPWLLDLIDVPVYAPPFAAALLRDEFLEHGLEGKVDLRIIHHGSRVKIGPFDLEFIRVNHSIPDTFAVAIQSPAGLLVHTADYKIDKNPLGELPIDEARFRALGDSGVRALFADSTNSEVHGRSGSERLAHEGLEQVIAGAAGRVFVTMFSTNVWRIQALLDIALKTRRALCITGRSLQRCYRIGIELGHLKIPAGVKVLELDEAATWGRDRVIVACTGSQAQPRSVLMRLSEDDFRPLRIEEGDLVVFSARAIPGNERSINALKDQLVRRGARIYLGDQHVHVSGHACRDEQAEMIGWVKPQLFVPVHGDHRYQRAQADTAKALGFKRSHVLDNGDVLQIDPADSRVVAHEPTHAIVVDGMPVGGLDSDALKDRRRLARQGIVVVSLAIDDETGEMVDGPYVLNRGALGPEDLDDGVLDALIDAIGKEILRLPRLVRRNRREVSEAVREITRRTLRAQTERKPIVEAIVYLV
jgi:ribonuclease J